MEYRVWEKLNIKTSLLGFGTMRLPLLADGSIDGAAAEKMIDRAMDNGVNYIDTAYPYINGDCEPFVQRVLNKHDRKTYYLATKLPCWEIRKPDDARRIFEDQLRRLDTDSIDYYMLHGLNKQYWNDMLGLGAVAFCKKLKADGKIRYLGFSFHDSYEVFESILTAQKWDFCQIQLNYMDTDEQAGIKGYKLTEKMGVPLIIMEPVKGGLLADLPDDCTNIFRQANPDASNASWALRWVASLPNVKVILSGMSNMQQVDDNLKTFDHLQSLDENEYKTIELVAKALRKKVKNGCTGCRYCMPCSQGVDIPRNFKIWNNYGIFQKEAVTAWEWNNTIEDVQKAKHCIDCGACEKACPQGISIRECLKQLQSELDNLGS